MNHEILYWLVVSTHPKNISQIGSFPQVGVKKKYLKLLPSLWLVHKHPYFMADYFFTG